MSNQPLTIAEGTSSSITKTMEIPETNPPAQELALQKFGQSVSIPNVAESLFHSYSPFQLLQNWQKLAHLDLLEFVYDDWSHDLKLFMSHKGSELFNYVSFLRADLEIEAKVISNFQQVGYILATFSVAESVDFGESQYISTFLSRAAEKYTRPFQIIPLGFNSAHRFRIPWNTVVPFWDRTGTKKTPPHGLLNFNLELKTPIDAVLFKPSVDLFYRYTNIQVGGMHFTTTNYGN